MYRCVVRFVDLQDGGYKYNPGDVYPREGISPSEDRIKELSTDANRRGIPLIEEEEVKKDADADMPVPQKLVRPRKKKG